jgi:hypothetical protein
MSEEPWWVKLLFVAVFLGAGALTFLVSSPLADWVKSSKSDWLGTFAAQALFALPVALLIFSFEEKAVWKLVRRDAFSTIHPISIGAFVGYVAHFATN